MDSGDKFFSWFAIETYGSPPTLAILRGSAGMCAPHTRRAVGEPGAASRMAFVYEQVMPAALARLTGEPPALRACPACHSTTQASQHALSTVTDALLDATVAGRYAHSHGLCVPHLAAAVPIDPERGRLLVQTAIAQLSHDPVGIATLAGSDDDAPARARLRDTLPAEDLPGAHADGRPDTIQRLRDRLAIDACPVCLAAGQGERRYLAWMSTEYATSGAEVLRNQPGGVCPRHLYDMVELDPQLAGWAAMLTRQQWLGRLTRVLRRLDPPPAQYPRGRPAPARAAQADEQQRPRRPSRRLRRLLQSRAARASAAYQAIEPDACIVCRAVEQYARGQMRLLLAGLRLRPVAAAYEQSHGLCLRHVLALPSGCAAGPLAREVAAGWAGLLAAELREAKRKEAFLARHEAAGPEEAAWLRAAGFLDGSVFLGGPARRLKAATAHRW